MADAVPGIFNLTAPAVMAHPNLFVPKAFGKKGKETGEPKYSANLLLPLDHPDLPGIKATIMAVARGKWPARDIGAEIKAGTFKMPLTSGDKQVERAKKKLADAGKADDNRADYQAGKIIIAGRSKYEPKLAGIENGKVVDYIDAARAAAKNKFYFGVHVLAQLNFVAYDGVGANPDGVTAYLNMVLTLNKGERLTAGTSAAETFRGYVGQASAEDPTGASDDIPF